MTQDPNDQCNITHHRSSFIIILPFLFPSFSFSCSFPFPRLKLYMYVYGFEIPTHQAVEQQQQLQHDPLRQQVWCCVPGDDDLP